MSESAIVVAIRARPLDKEEEPMPFGVLSFEEAAVTMHAKTYAYDHVFPPGVTNKKVYDVTVADKIQHIFEGCNVTILAYGSTGSGKTYTMGTNHDASKNESDVGIIPLCIQELFSAMASRQNSTNFAVKISFLELYREEIYDLLQKPPLQCALREDADGIKVSNLTEVPVKSVDEAFITLKKGVISRRTCATAKNTNSSRSHGIFSVFVEQTDKVTLDFKRCKFQLVDLAGSERVGSSKTTGLQVKEGININLGLLTLRHVISKLSGDKKQHIPYRNSKLTRLLQDSLGGNSHTLMIACISLSNQSLEETGSTIRYASSARKIQNQPKPVIDPPAVQIEKLKKQLYELKLSIARGEAVSDQNIIANPVEASERHDELYQELQKAYVRIKNLCQESIKFQEKNSKATDSFKAVNEKIKQLIAELTAEAAAAVNENQFFTQTLKSVEEIHHDMFQLLVSEESGETFDSTPELLEDKENSNLPDSCQSSFMASDLDINEQSASNKKLTEISECITIKAGLVKNLEDYFQTVETVDQAYVSSLVEKINKLVKEKEALEESKKSVAEKMEKSNQEKISKYECEIKELQKELRSKKIVLQTKEENQRKIKLLQKEIEDMKRLKVDLLKQVKEGGNKYLRLQREKNKEVAQLVKDSRKKEVASSRMIQKLENQLTVMKKRLDQKTLDKKTTKKAIEQRKLKSSQTNLEPIEKRIDQVLDVMVGMKTAEVQHKETEDELNAMIPFIQKYEAHAEENLSKEEEDCVKEKIESAKSFIQSCLDKNKEDRKETQHYNENEIVSNFMNTLSTFPDAKIAIQYLLKQYLIMMEKYEKESSVKSIEIYKGHQENSCHLDKINLLEEQITELRSEIDCVKREFEVKVLQKKQEVDSLKSELVEKVQGLLRKQQDITAEHSDQPHDAELLDKIKLQDEMIEALHIMCDDYKTKTREIQQLSQQVMNAKKGKRVTWLGNLTKASPIDTTFSMDVDEDKSFSIIQDFLDESVEESFTNDVNDPDWRATPVYKQRQKSSRKLSPEISDDTDCPPVKRSPVGCNCSGECKTMRCKCKKRNLDCGNGCLCNKDNCTNNQSGIPMPEKK